MKKITAFLVLGVIAGFTSMSTIAATACSGTAGNGSAVTGADNGSKFVRIEFTPKCSANVLADYTDQQTSFAVAAGSKKGKTTFIGNSAGGGVTATTTPCSASGCTSSELATALTAAEAIATGTGSSSSSSSSSSTSSGGGT